MKAKLFILALLVSSALGAQNDLKLVQEGALGVPAQRLVPAAGPITSTATFLSQLGIAPLVSPSFTTPTLGVATATSLNGNTFTTGTYTLTGTAAKTLNFTNSLTLSGTDATTMTFPTTSATLARTDAANTFTGIQSMTSPAITTSLTTPSTTFALINTTATTVNFAGAATTINMGNAAGTTNLLGALNLNPSGSASGIVTLNGVTSGKTVYTTADATAQTVTITTAAQTVGAVGLTIPNFASVNDTFTFNTLAATLANKTLTSPVISTGLTASGSAANTFAGSTGTFITSTGANILSGAVTINDATTPSLTTASGKTNTGFVQINGKTSGGLKLIAADAAAQTVTVSLAAQTVGASTQTIPDMAGTSDTFSFLGKSQTWTGTNTFNGSLAGTHAQNLGSADYPTFSNAQLTNSTLTYAASVAIDFSGDAFKTVTLTGNITFTTSNLANGRSVTVRIIGDGSIRTYTFPGTWTFVGAAAPASLAANKTAILTLTSFSTTDANVVAAYSAAP